MVDSELLTIAEAAERMRLSKAEVRRLVLREEKLKAIFFGRKKTQIRIPVRAISEFVQREMENNE